MLGSLRVLTICLLIPSFASAQNMSQATAVTVKDLETFLKAANERLNDLSVKYNQAQWVQETYITDDTEAVAAAKRFDNLQASPELTRQLKLLKLLVAAPAPNDPKQRAELARLGAWLSGIYGKGKYCPKTGPFAGQCMGQSEMEKAMASTKDPEVLLDLWVGWRTISAPMRQNYTRFAELANKAAREMGFSDLGALWRSNYDMTPEQFSAELDRLWNQVRPLYLSLHAYVRSQLVKKYGAQMVPPTGPIPAHLLGNIWAQDWTHIYDLLNVPSGSGVDLTPILQQKHIDDLQMVRYGEAFFTSLGFDPLPKTFWERSMFRKPADRDVICHASAWDIDNQEDLRLKMCIRIND